ncbi:acyl carrier protein [Actinophytocola sp.]|uniref:acyl carrier protein n=1 Tax=Actinophytocola sp. TaxID=1872138 RepID=UPI00389A063C
MSASAEIREFIHGRYPTAELDDTEDIFSLGYVNSLFAMELVTFLENQFAIRIPNEELFLDNFRTIQAMTGLVERQRELVDGTR